MIHRIMKGAARGIGGAALAGLGGLAACAEAGAGATLTSTTETTLAQAGASNPTVALDDASGVGYAAWVETTGGESDVFVARIGLDGDDGERVRVNHIPGDAAPHAQAPAQVATGPGNDVYVVWQNTRDVEWLDFGAADVRFARSGDGGRTWQPAITVNDDAQEAPARHTFHDIVVAPDGTIYVSWIDARVRDRERMEGYQAAAAGESTEGAPDAAAAEPGTEIRVARSTDGGRSFSDSVVLETNSCPCCRTSMAAGPDGALYVTWRKIYEGDVRDIALARSTDGGRSFSEPMRVHLDGWVFPGCPHAGADVTVDREGRVYVAWYTGAPDRTGAYLAVSEDGGASFGPPTRLTPEGAIPTTQVSVTADGAGGVWVAWEDPEGEVPSVKLARVVPDGTLQPVDLGGPAGALPSLAASDPHLAAAWLEGESVHVLRGIDED
ncbi:MAG: sialidase family protein [Gemmatimonadota bacterium]